MIGHGDYAFVINQVGHIRRDSTTTPAPPPRPPSPPSPPLASAAPAAAGLMINGPGAPPPRQRPSPSRWSRRLSAAHRQPAGTSGAPVTAAPVPPLATSIASADATWAAVVMGGPAAQENNFWQLFTRPAGSGTWRLSPPPARRRRRPGPGLAGRRWLCHRVRPSRVPAPSPLAATPDGGGTWSQSGVLNARPGHVPDALAAAPRDRPPARPDRQRPADLGAPAGTGWTTLAARHPSCTARQAGRACGLSGLTAAAFTPAGTPLLAGTCILRAARIRPGATWRLIGPALHPPWPASPSQS